MRCVLIGNYGVGNLGDEALKDYFLTTFPAINWIVLTADPKAANEVPRLPCGLRSLFRQWGRTVHAIRNADAAVFGGGSLFTDSESSFASVLWGWHAFVCWVFRTPFYLAFQGIGPFNVFRSELITRWVVRHAAQVSVRDSASFQRVELWKMNKKIVQSFDPVYEIIYAYRGKKYSPSVLVLIPRRNSNESYLSLVRSALSERPDTAVRIVLMQRDEEEGILAQLRKLVPEERCQVVSVKTVADLVSSLQDASLVVTERYHGALAASALAIPFKICSQAKGDKLDALRLELSTPEDLVRALELVLRGREALRAVISLQ